MVSASPMRAAVLAHGCPGDPLRAVWGAWPWWPAGPWGGPCRVGTIYILITVRGWVSPPSTLSWAARGCRGGWLASRVLGACQGCNPPGSLSGCAGFS